MSEIKAITQLRENGFFEHKKNIIDPRTLRRSTDDVFAGLNKLPLDIVYIIFDYFTFDEFCKIKEIYSCNYCPSLLTWDNYFKRNPNIQIHRTKFNPSMFDIYIKIGKNKITIPILIDCCYAKLISYLLNKYYSESDPMNISNMPLTWQQTMISFNTCVDESVLTNQKMKFYKRPRMIRQYSNLSDCFKFRSFKMLTYFLETLEIKPTFDDLERAKKVFGQTGYDIINYFI